MKRQALQNKQVGVLRMAFRARKVFGTFEKRAPDVSRDEVEGNIRTRGKTKLTSFPRDYTLSALLYI